MLGKYADPEKMGSLQDHYDRVNYLNSEMRRLIMDYFSQVQELAIRRGIPQKLNMVDMGFELLHTKDPEFNEIHKKYMGERERIDELYHKEVSV
jgi:uncharacterized protein (UPF0262 family)